MSFSRAPACGVGSAICDTKHVNLNDCGAQEPAAIAVLGLGYVGCVTAACLAELGHSVIGVDRDESKVKNITEGRAPFYEPGLEALVESGIKSGCLRATTSAGEAVRDADIVMVCVGTPSERNGNLGLDQMRRAVEEVAASVAGRTKPLIVAIRST